MIKSFEELGEVLAEFENRISYLEMSANSSLEQQAPQPQEIIHRHSDMSKQEFARLLALEGEVKYLRAKLTERGAKKQDYY